MSPHFVGAARSFSSPGRQLHGTVYRRPLRRYGMGPRILAVWTRPLDGVDQFGRVNVARQVRAALALSGRVLNERQHNVLESRVRFIGIVAAVSALLAGLATFRPLPLQCAFF